MSRAEIVAELERYRGSLVAPVIEGVEVTALEPRNDGFWVTTSRGSMTVRCVVVCTGAYQRPFQPGGAGDLPPHLLSMDTRSYRDPGGLPEGAVLVVGSGQSGCQIAEELCDAGREVILSCGKAPWAPRRIGDHDLLWWALETGFMDGTLDSLPTPEARLTANVTASGVDGGHDLHPRSLHAKGVTLAGRFAGSDEGRLRFDDDLAETIAWDDARFHEFEGLVVALCAERGISPPGLPDPGPLDPAAPVSVEASAIGSVIFSGGFRPDYGWVRVPGVFDSMGFPVQTDGASTVAPGLFFVGVHFLRKRKSSLLCGVGEDAAVVAGAVARFLGSG